RLDPEPAARADDAARNLASVGDEHTAEHEPSLIARCVGREVPLRHSLQLSVSSRSPSWTVSPAVTRRSCTVPAAGASTGTSIFIDSRRSSSSSSATIAPACTNTSTIIPTIGARTSVIACPHLFQVTSEGHFPLSKANLSGHRTHAASIPIWCCFLTASAVHYRLPVLLTTRHACAAWHFPIGHSPWCWLRGSCQINTEIALSAAVRAAYGSFRGGSRPACRM